MTTRSVTATRPTTNQTTDELQDFLRQFPATTLPHHHVVETAEDTAYAVMVGAVRMYTISAETGSALTLHVFRSGAIFPLIALLGHQSNHFLYETTATTCLRAIPRGELTTFLVEHPPELLALTGRILTGLDHLTARLELLAFTNVTGRVISAISYLVRHEGIPQPDGAINIGHHTHQSIAEFVGATREATSLAIERLIHLGLITYRGHEIVIPSTKRLEQARCASANHKHMTTTDPGNGSGSPLPDEE